MQLKGHVVMEMFLTQPPVRRVGLEVTPVGDAQSSSLKLGGVVKEGGIRLRHVVKAVGKMRVKGGVGGILTLPAQRWVVVEEQDEVEIAERTKAWELETAREESKHET